MPGGWSAPWPATTTSTSSSAAPTGPVTALTPEVFRITIAALRSVDLNESRLFISQGNSTSRAFGYKLVIRVLPTAQRHAVWRPDKYGTHICPRSNLEVETILHHSLVCPANDISPAHFGTQFREELSECIPRKHFTEVGIIANQLLAAGLSMAGSIGVVQTVPLRMSQSSAALAALRAFLCVTYSDYWKPRCTAVIAAKGRRGLSRLQKSSPTGRLLASRPPWPT